MLQLSNDTVTYPPRSEVVSGPCTELNSNGTVSKMAALQSDAAIFSYYPYHSELVELVSGPFAELNIYESRTICSLGDSPCAGNSTKTIEIFDLLPRVSCQLPPPARASAIVSPSSQRKRKPPACDAAAATMMMPFNQYW